MGDLLNFLFKYYYIGLHDGYSCYVNLYFHILSQINHHYTNVFYHSIFCPLLFVFFFSLGNLQTMIVLKPAYNIILHRPLYIPLSIVLRLMRWIKLLLKKPWKTNEISQIPQGTNLTCINIVLIVFKIDNFIWNFNLLLFHLFPFFEK